MITEFRSVRGEGTSTGISDKGPVLAMVMTWAAVVYATLTLLYWFCDSGYNYNRVPFLYFEHTRPWLVTKYGAGGHVWSQCGHVWCREVI